MTTTNSKIPVWIIILSGILAAFGLGLGLLGYINPSMAYQQLNKAAQGNNIGMMIIAARNISMAVIIVLAIISKNPRLLGLVLIMRLLTEFQDAISTIAGAQDGISAVIPSLIFLVIIMIVEVIAIGKLNRLANAR